MNLSEHQMDVLDRFLRNEMTEADNTLWKKMMMDPLVQDEVRNMTHLQKMIQQEGRERLRSELKSWDSKINDGNKKMKKSIIIGWRWIAAACVILLSSVFIFKSINNVSKDVFAEFFEPYPNVVAPLQKGIDENNTYQNAFRQYELSNYKKAESAFKELPQNDPNVIFYHAMTMIINGKHVEASEKLELLASSSEHAYRDATEWYISLLKLESGDFDNCTNSLKRIAGNSDHSFYRNAVNLLQELEH
jgi:hypothetical protein